MIDKSQRADLLKKAMLGFDNEGIAFLEIDEILKIADKLPALTQNTDAYENKSVSTKKLRDDTPGESLPPAEFSVKQVI